jgi:BioD-like phosphotransacetylase family protein
MSFLFIGTTGDRAGHSLVTWAVARGLANRGLSVGFIKPFGTDPIHIEGLWTDRDAFLFKKVLNLQEPLDRICPYLLSDEIWKQEGVEETLEKIKSLAQELSVAKDILLIMGSKHLFFDKAAYPISDISLVSELKADFVLVDRYQKTSSSIYSILSVSSLLKDRIKGVILNRVPPGKLAEIRDKVIPSLVKKGIQITAALPEDPALSFRSLREIIEVLNGEVLCGGENLGRIVGGMTVGSSDLWGELLALKRIYNKVILLEPFSPETGIKEAQVHRPIAGILLTGGQNPAPQVLRLAKKANIPLILLKDDTFAAVERLEQFTPILSPKDEDKVRHLTELMDLDGAFDRLFQSLGLIP